MKLTLDTVSAPATGSRAAEIIRAVSKGGAVMNQQGRAFIASLVDEIRGGRRKPARVRRK